MIVKICPVACEPEEDGEGWRLQLFVHSSVDARFLMAHLGQEIAMSFHQRTPSQCLNMVESNVVNPEDG